MKKIILSLLLTIFCGASAQAEITFINRISSKDRFYVYDQHADLIQCLAARTTSCPKNESVTILAPNTLFIKDIHNFYTLNIPAFHNNDQIMCLDFLGLNETNNKLSICIYFSKSPFSLRLELLPD